MKESIESRKQRFKEMLSRKEISMEMLSMVYYSFNRHAKSCWEDRDRFTDYSDFILDSLLTPIEIHIIHGRHYVYYDYGEFSFYKRVLQDLA